MSIKSILLAGELPYSAVAVLILAAYMGGNVTHKEPTKFAIAERGAIVLESVLEKGTDSSEALEEEVSKPIVRILKKYADLGYVVIDSSKDDSGNMVIAAVPEDVIDITNEMREAVMAASKTRKGESK